MSSIKTAMILAAGRGTRMRHLTDVLPKPALTVCGKPLLAHLVDRIKAYGISDIVVNTCYLGDKIKNVLAKEDIRCTFSDETTALETGGGVKNALPLLLPRGQDGFFVMNADPLWDEPTTPLLTQLAAKWNPDEMDVLLGVIPLAQKYGDMDDGDFFIENGRLRRKRPGESNIPYRFVGVQILHPRVFENTTDGAFSLRDVYDVAESKGRLAHIVFDGRWFHVSSPESIEETERIYFQREQK